MLADMRVEVVLGIPFLSFNNINIKFVEIEKLTWKAYITTNILATTTQVILINKNEFANAALDKYSETFIIHMTALEVILICLSWAIHLTAL